MFEVGDRVVVESITDEDKAKYLGKIHTIREKDGDRYSFENGMIFHVSYGLRSFNHSPRTWWTDKELRLVTIGDDLDEIRGELKGVISEVEQIKRYDFNKKATTRLLDIEEDSFMDGLKEDTKAVAIVSYTLGMISAVIISLIANMFS